MSAVSVRHAVANRRTFVAALTIGGLLMTGCSANSTTSASNSTSTMSAASTEATTVTVMYAGNEFSKKDIAAFEQANPTIKVNFIEFDQTRLNAMLTAGDPPDLVRGNPSANLFARGLATPLDDFVKNSTVIKADDLESVNDAWRYDGKVRGQGKLYGIVKDWSPDLTIWQNQGVFDKAGVKPLSTTTPSTWEDVLAAGMALKDKGVKNSFGIEWQWGVASLLQTQILQQGGTYYNADLTSVNLQTPEAIKSIQFLTDYGKAGVGPTSLAPLADGMNLPVFAKGDMAMSMDGYWFGGGLQAQEAAAVAAGASLVPAPSWGKRISTVIGGVGAWIPEKAKHKEAAWKVMEYLMAGPPAVERAKSGWGLPAMKSLWAQLPAAAPYQKQAIEAAKAELPYVTLLPDSPFISGDEWNKIVDEALKATINGSSTPAEAVKTIEAKVNDALAKGKDQLG